MAKLKKGDRKLLNAWAFYDWANSVYSLVIASAIFPIYYQALFEVGEVHTIVVFGGEIRSTPLISYTTAAAFLVVAMISPLLSGIADFIGNKKSFMKFFCYLGGVSTMCLYFFDLENIHISLLFYFFGLIGFWGSLVFYNSYLPDIAYPEQQDKISARGYAWGYVGSVILLIFNLSMVLNPQWFGLGEGNQAAMEAMKWSFVSVGIWWILFSQYTFYYLPKGRRNKQGVSKKILLNGFQELKKVSESLSKDLRLKRYLTAFFVYSMAVQTVMLVATYFGEQEIAWADDTEKTTGLIISILVIQLIAVLGATLTSKASEKFGNIATLITLNIIWVAICVIAYFIYLPLHFYITAAFVGLVMGGIQSLSRSTYSKLLPKTTDTTSFFSFYDVSEKIGIVIGMALYGFIDQITGSMRNSIVFLATFFIVGVLLLFRIPKVKSISPNE